MSLDIYYTPKARKSLQFLYAFIEGKFGRRHAEKFIREADRTILVLREQPYLFKQSGLGEHIRLGLISRYTSFLYEVTDTRIILHFFWDNRQEPFYE